MAPPIVNTAARLAGLATLLAWSSGGRALAWVYPEHRDIAALAVERLDPARRAVLAGLWSEARLGHEQRLCERAADATQGVEPSCIDWAALSAIAGDHSCSSQEMTTTTLESGWILPVAAIAARLKLDLSRIDVLPRIDQVTRTDDVIVDFRRRMQTEAARAERLNALRSADTRLQGADPEYATRAGSNGAHFLLARPRTDTSAPDYAVLTMSRGSEISAVGVYTWFHLSAMQKATRLAHEELAPDVRRDLARAALFDEAFALHFLEDVFAAGHVAGTWGDASQRKGTHDYYNEAGLEAFPWSGTGASMILMGDAHLRPEDAERAAAAVRTSLEQVLDAATGRPRAASLPHASVASTRPDAFDVCASARIEDRPETSTTMPEGFWRAFQVDLGEVLGSAPIPGLGPGLGAMPRFRSEVGRFTGLAAALDMQWVDGGFTASEGHGALGGVEMSLRFGLGLDGVMGDAGDGLVFLSVGLRGDSPSSNSIADSALAEQGGNLTAAIPSRTGLATRLRMPFFLIPGDLFLLLPVYLFSPEWYASMAVTAGNGGLIPWQAGWATRIGRFQFVAGRELGVTFHGLAGGDRVLAPGASPGDPVRVVSYRSVSFDLPILEYRPYRSFASNQSSTVLVQLFTAMDVPHSAKVEAPAGAPDVELRTVWSVGFRLVFDWRYYP